MLYILQEVQSWNHVFNNKDVNNNNGGMIVLPEMGLQTILIHPEQICRKNDFINIQCSDVTTKKKIRVWKIFHAMIIIIIALFRIG
jgi:hypothetical protein